MCLARRVVCVGLYAWLDGQYAYVRTHMAWAEMIVLSSLPASDLPPYNNYSTIFFCRLLGHNAITPMTLRTSDDISNIELTFPLLQHMMA